MPRSNAVDLMHINRNIEPLSTTTLYGLEPIEAKTSLVEGLSSYISRLSHEHSLSVRDVLSRVLIPCYNISTDTENQKKTSEIFNNSYSINGTLTLAKELSSKFGELTGRTDLADLTMLTWEGSISSINLLHKYRRWC